MELMIKLWKDFKTQPEIWFFYGFILTFTLTVRKVLWFFPLRGEFNEYSGIYLYLSDIFLGLTLISWVIIILYNKIDILSMCRDISKKEYSASTEMFHACSVAKKCSIPVGMFHVEHPTGQAWNFLYGKRKTIIYILLPLVLVGWSFTSIIWAENRIVSVFRSVKFLEFYLLYIFVLVRLFYWNINNNVPRGTLLKKIFGFIMIISLIQAIIGIVQFFIQHSIGLFWLRESLISPDIAGVAKVIFNGEAFVRAYGLFPHPNILGGFLLFSILISLLYYRMFHACHVAKKCSTWNISFATGVEHFKNLRGGTIFKIILGIQLLALILTFSKSAILGLILGLVYYVYKNVPRGTFFSYLRKKKRLIFASGLIIIFTFIITKPDLHSFFIRSLNDRSVYVNVSPARIAMQSIAGGRGTVEDIKTFILGIGNSQFVISMENLPVIKENWMLEPVHNVFLLVWSELGLVGLLVLLLALGFILKGMFHPRSKEIVPRGTISCYGAGVEQFQDLRNGTLLELEKTFGTVFIGLLFIMSFDHYLWDIHQGSFLLWMTLGFLVGAGECEDKA